MWHVKFSAVIAAVLVAAASSFVSVHADPVHVGLEIRHYGIDAELVSDTGNAIEIFLVITDGNEKKKVFVEVSAPYGGYDESALSGTRYKVRISSSLGSDYLLTVEGKKVTLEKIELAYDRQKGDLVPKDGTSVILRTEKLARTGVVFDPVVEITPKNLYSRPLQLQAKRMYGEDVWALQRFLDLQHYEVGDIDGWFGPQTQAAVKQYQSDHGLSPDGVVGPELWNKISGPKPEYFRGDWG